MLPRWSGRGGSTYGLGDACRQSAIQPTTTAMERMMMRAYQMEMVELDRSIEVNGEPRSASKSNRDGAELAGPTSRPTVGAPGNGNHVVLPRGKKKRAGSPSAAARCAAMASRRTSYAFCSEKSSGSSKASSTVAAA
eukprot:scaffold33027_cov124-Isochrysis_galbana.AAC.4